MRFVSRLGFGAKLSLGIAAIILLTSVPTALVVGRMAARALMAESAERGRVLAESLAARAANPMLAFDLLRLKNLADALKNAADDIEYVFFQDAAGQVLVHTFTGGFPGELAGAARPGDDKRASREVLDTGQGRIDDFAARVASGGQTLGVVRLGMSRTKIQNETGGLLFAVAAVSGAALCVSVLCAALFSGALAKRINLQIKTYQDQLIQSQKMESLGKLAGGVAHEINTPLSIILGYSQLLAEDAPEGSQMRDDLRLIEKHTLICRKIVSDLLGFSRQRQSRLDEARLCATVEEALDMVRHSLTLENVTIETVAAQDAPRIVCDAEKLKQVWINLVDNARDAMPRGGIVSVRCRADIERGKAVVSVADTGEGISKADLAKVFDPFFTTKPAGRGTGLGLSVTFGIVQEHGGTVRAASPLPEEFVSPAMQRLPGRGPGSVFIVELPLDGKAGREA